MYRMKELRTVEFIANYTIRKIAEETGISTAYIKEIISRRKSCSKPYAIALANFKGKDLDYFFDKVN